MIGVLLEYSFRLLPGLFVVIIFYLLIRKIHPLLNIVVLIFGFILIRDTMTPVGLWEFGVEDHILWLRFAEDGFVLAVMGLFSLFITLMICYSNKSLATQMSWFTLQQKVKSILLGIFAAVIIAGPFMVPYFFMSIGERGGQVPTSLWIPLVMLALFGNLLEEVLFRVFFQTQLSEKVGKIHAILLSGLFFAVGHTFLAITVTDLGPWVLIFTLYEGLVLAFVYERYGLISATLAHGLAIFILAAGII